MKTMFWKRLIVSCKLAIFSVLMWLSEYFSLRTLKRGHNDKHCENSKNGALEASDSDLQIGYLLGRNGVK